jgi:hypothetical protein
MADLLRRWCEPATPGNRWEDIVNDARPILQRFALRTFPIPLEVKSGDRILYHPAVQSFDRKINPELIGLKPEEGDC